MPVSEICQRPWGRVVRIWMCPEGRSRQFSEDLEGGTAGDRGSEERDHPQAIFVLLFSDVE